ncbi:secretoglobin family 3A member 1 [Ursus americanus]|uniref:secretoglobin family 3A member 1 n=1 Tax=Ursus americanus TaxID=9643 RepID=UPI001E67B9A5|nr:secretoglobin family 3A member 1 [Ursus americanus]XP_057163353.1 secretoglobin family 3A member 1 [Ursus arctos]
MKLTAAFLVLCVALLGHPAATLFLSSMAKPVASASHALNPAAEAGAAAVAGAGAMAEAGAMAPPFLGGFNPLKFMLTILGIPVEHLVEGSRKCVAELGPEAMEAMGAVKALLGALTYIG